MCLPDGFNLIVDCCYNYNFEITSRSWKLSGKVLELYPD